MPNAPKTSFPEMVYAEPTPVTQEPIKSRYESKTIVSSIVTITMIVLTLLGYQVGQATVEQFVGAIVALAAAGFAIYGRIVANKKIG